MAAGIAMAVLALAGCGKKGPIVPPERRLPAPPADMRATVDNRVIVVQFVAPKTRVDNSRLRDLTLMRLFRREEPPEGPLKPAMRSGGTMAPFFPQPARAKSAMARPAAMTALRRGPITAREPG